ncbi:site-2 protease family protein [Yoonia sp.]|uniref:site-2 protease family protein n=1 Tax=Yoonia sp. TaxID=2212373 RepID=UPI003F6CF670
MLTKRIELFTILGFRVSLDLTWIILAVLITWSLATGYFPQTIGDLGARSAWWLGLAGALGLFLSIILHEFSHALVARRFDLPIRGITLFIFGGVAEMENEPPNAQAEFFMAIAGPIMSYVLAGLFLGLSMLAPGTMLPALFGYLALINTVLATFNLIPAFPLDGGRMLRAALWWWTENYARATRISAAMGRGFGIFLILLGVLNLVSGGTVVGIWQALIGFFILSAATSSEMHMTLKFNLENRTVRQIMVHDPVSIPAQTPLSDVIEDYFYRHHHTAFPVVRNGEVLGCLRLEDVGRIAADQRPHKTASEALPAQSRIGTVTPDTPVLAALKTMQKNKASRLIVAEGGVLKGMLTMRDILNDLTIRQALQTEHMHDDAATAVKV